jgi:hypothetical protein
MSQLLIDFFKEQYQLARARDLETSKAAAAAILPKIGKIQREVLAYAEQRAQFGFTDVAMNQHFNATSSTYRTRRRELCDLSMIRNSGRTQLINGKQHTVWVHKDFYNDKP